MSLTTVKRALLSVSNKQGIVQFAQNLTDLGVELVSTGGTSQLLREAGVPHQQVEDITGLPEMLDGRVKTLHPKIHGGILGRRDVHADEAGKHQLAWIDLVVVNFYPFAEAIAQKKLSWDEVVEYIDVGGPTMVRAAAKNFAWVGVATDPEDYETIINELRAQQGLLVGTRKRLAHKAFTMTAHYDAMIQDYFHQQDKQAVESETKLLLRLEKSDELRYGENPHQKAYAYQWQQEKIGILSAKQHQGKPLSYNNILDAEAAWACVREFTAPACVIVKHANPCGAATAATTEAAYAKAYQTDPLSAFGGIVALNAPCTKELAEAITQIFMEVVLAPSYTEEALAVFAGKPNLRVLALPISGHAAWEMRFITGGVLLQEKDQQVLSAADLTVVTQRKPSSQEIQDMLFAWRVLKHIKSNGILIAKDSAAIGIGAGQVSRIDAVDIALRKAGDKLSASILASDAFFPFRDSIDRIAASDVRAIIQPGGSVRDAEVIAACE